MPDVRAPVNDELWLFPQELLLASGGESQGPPVKFRTDGRLPLVSSFLLDDPQSKRQLPASSVPTNGSV